MEEETNIMMSSTTTYLTGDCDSSSTNNMQSKKHKRNAYTRKACISGSRFKGVVGQHNGHWGAQIYTNQQRIWLGTFKSETEAAMAYDSAAIRLRSQDSHRNLPWTNSTVQEPNFQRQFSTEDILRMIKEGSYPTKFDEYLKEKYEECHPFNTLPVAELKANEGFSYKQLFQKELTPSDVGKLNRLVIPKKYASKYFPQIQEVPDVELVFYDTSRRQWKFRYCYWKSSQSFVFTKGWNRFVKDKGLRANDTIVFNLCEYKTGPKEISADFVIDVLKGVEVLPEPKVEIEERMKTQSTDDHAVEPVWLFGVQIGWSTNNDDDDYMNRHFFI
ncbi:AP2/ERF and B3 domain-containing transcription factor At1g51120 [Nicotiana sylvestris]|uniref:AP2/ERF and B3 domain-containing transcription factor At1g51120-like n=3 Tax=Nicotiana TaxID=4085 RepID=A0A1S4BTX1_TOBAC|nr:PREDICTED: AP2/ERF and B3 domain-containing transcription factor At1g51120 [Nicotiana sylvestris]XP_016492322.1 PREDICTED: AP2/ERF and B3 domain-containing transcription factor At1g51120-like [Nicotiana tabacum]